LRILHFPLDVPNFADLLQERSQTAISLQQLVPVTFHLPLSTFRFFFESKGVTSLYHSLRCAADSVGRRRLLGLSS